MQKKIKLTNVRKGRPLAKKNLPKTGLEIAARRWWKNDDQRYSSEDVEIGKKVLKKLEY